MLLLFIGKSTIHFKLWTQKRATSDKGSYVLIPCRNHLQCHISLSRSNEAVSLVKYCPADSVLHTLMSYQKGLDIWNTYSNNQWTLRGRVAVKLLFFINWNPYVLFSFGMMWNQNNYFTFYNMHIACNLDPPPPNNYN